ncbi:tol-pal system-associated acyl-CoA thioesterase [Roseateles sp. DAIF2]|uniref:tol-pal system-associated acyl-CoA thioesterase n=1 Tax=Roseateles sp. DAIF2 TaxID=2714952 RepID=UPI0018A2D8F0|nr:tol-pal system-associated acyl-CoA thioesterase [Roseateles sp. DAIF2]QPF73839.1 tol-pal system-associated acyl-CoA thioesterase [Roseateles sp. DAIF2]
MIDFEHGLRVYWEDTDAGGVVFYANYLKFFERARTEWLRALGFEQERLRVEGGAMFIVGGTTVRYLSPARLDDFLQVSVRLTERGRVSMTLFQQARRASDGALLAEGEIRIGCVDSRTFKPTRIPVSILQALDAAASTLPAPIPE